MKLEQILREEVLKSTKGKEYEHNITGQGIINAMKRYALENIKADRERYKNEIKSLLDEEGVLYCFEGDYFPATQLVDVIDTDSLPIELP